MTKDPDLRLLNPLQIIRAASKEVPVIRFALGIAAIAAAAGLVRSFVGGLLQGVVAVGILLVLMVVLIVVAWIARLVGSSVRIVALTFLCLMLLAFVIPLALAISSLFFCVPRNLCRLLDPPEAAAAATSVAPPAHSPDSGLPIGKKAVGDSPNNPSPTTEVVVSGHIVEEGTGEPISGALVSIEGTQARWYTDAQGRFQGRVSRRSDERIEVTVSQDGYKTHTFGLTTSIGHRLTLQRRF